MAENDRSYMLADAPMLALSLPRWEEAMLSCFHFEVNVRLLAGKFFPAESVTREIGDLKNGLLILLYQVLAFTDSEKTFLSKANTLRNKLIHCEPDAVRRLVQELVPAFQPPNVIQQIPLSENVTGAAIADALVNRTGAVNVADTSSRDEGFLGWMIQAAGDGTFDLAARSFKHAIGIIGVKARQTDAAPTQAPQRDAK
jgi:hypothetical protein